MLFFLLLCWLWRRRNNDVINNELVTDSDIIRQINLMEQNCKVLFSDQPRAQTNQLNSMLTIVCRVDPVELGLVHGVLRDHARVWIVGFQFHGYMGKTYILLTELKVILRGVGLAKRL